MKSSFRVSLVWISLIGWLAYVDVYCQELFEINLPLFGEHMVVEGKIDNNTPKHFYGAMVLTGSINAFQDIVGIDDSKIIKNTTFMVSTAVVAFEIGQATWNGKAGIIDTLAGIAGMIIQNQISKRLHIGKRRKTQDQHALDLIRAERVLVRFELKKLRKLSEKSEK